MFIMGMKSGATVTSRQGNLAAPTTTAANLIETFRNTGNKSHAKHESCVCASPFSAPSSVAKLRATGHAAQMGAGLRARALD